MHCNCKQSGEIPGTLRLSVGTSYLPYNPIQINEILIAYLFPCHWAEANVIKLNKNHFSTPIMHSGEDSSHSRLSKAGKFCKKKKFLSTHIQYMEITAQDRLKILAAEESTQSPPVFWTFCPDIPRLGPACHSGLTLIPRNNRVLCRTGTRRWSPILDCDGSHRHAPQPPASKT